MRSIMKFKFPQRHIFRKYGDEYDVGIDDIINCFREALGEDYFNSIIFELEQDHENSWFHMYVITISKPISDEQKSAILTNIENAKLESNLETTAPHN